MRHRRIPVCSEVTSLHCNYRQEVLRSVVFVGSLTSDQRLYWLAGGRRAVGRREPSVRAGAQRRNGVAGAWRRFAPYDAFSSLHWDLRIGRWNSQVKQSLVTDIRRHFSDVFRSLQYTWSCLWGFRFGARTKVNSSLCCWCYSFAKVWSYRWFAVIFLVVPQQPIPSEEPERYRLCQVSTRVC